MLPNDIILYINELTHNLYMLELKEELFYGVMNHVINTFTKMTSVIYYVIINSNTIELSKYFKFINEYYKTHTKFIDYFCYKYRNKYKNRITKIIESLHIINCYYMDEDNFIF